jgi:hypothetical protein
MELTCYRDGTLTIGGDIEQYKEQLEDLGGKYDNGLLVFKIDKQFEALKFISQINGNNIPKIKLEGRI